MRLRTAATSLALALGLALGAAAQAESSRSDAEKAAMLDAHSRLQAHLLQTSLDANWTVGTLLKRLDRANALDAILQAADMPGGVRWLDERSCQVKLQIDGGKLADALVSVATDARDPQVDPRWLRQVTADWPKQAFAATGSNCPLPAARAIPPAPPAMLPDQPPQWVFGLADAEATAKANASRLKTARLAEQQAADILRQRIRSLEVYPQVTLGDMADKNLALAKALNAGLQRARIYKTEYRADGSVVVRISLNLRLLWSELDAAR